MKVLFEGRQYDISLNYSGEKYDEIKALNLNINPNGLETDLLGGEDKPLGERVRIRFGKTIENIRINYDEENKRREIIIDENYWDKLDRCGELYAGNASWDILMKVNLF